MYILTYTCASRHSGVQFSTSELEKVLRDRRFLKIFTRKHASRPAACKFFDIGTSKSGPKLSRHSGAQFFDIGTSKSGPKLTCFVHFHLKRRAIFRHRNFKKWSEPDVLCTCSLENALLATAACNSDCSSDHMTPHPPL